MTPGEERFPQSDWIASLARLGDEREALCVGGRRVGYGELARAAHETAEGFASVDLRAGDLVAILAPPSLEGVALIHAMLDRGIVMLPLNARSSPTEQREALVASGARHLVMPGADWEGPSARGRQLLEGLGCGGLALSAGADRVVAQLDRRRAPAREVEALARSSRPRRVALQAALVLRTSGTSGRPKGAVLAFDNLIASARASAALLGSEARDRWLCCMPLFHIGGLSILIRAALVGASVVLHERFDASRVARSLEQEGITRTSFVATMLERVIEARSGAPAPAELELVLLGGGPASDELLARARAQGYPIAPTYGLTEASSQVATRPPGEANADLSGGLQPLPGVEVRVVDEARRPLQPGREGDIEVRGRIVMRGYLDDEAATSRAIRDGWLSTGDVGRLDADGRLRVLDRRADLVLSGGENVYPAEVESVLCELEGVREAGVFGIPDPVFGARPVAVVVPEDGAAFDPEALAAFCHERLADYKRPVRFFAAQALPRTATGKLLRRRLREEWLERC